MGSTAVFESDLCFKPVVGGKHPEFGQTGGGFQRLAVFCSQSGGIDTVLLVGYAPLGAELAAEVGILIGLLPAYAVVHVHGVQLAALLLQHVQQGHGIPAATQPDDDGLLQAIGRYG